MYDQTIPLRYTASGHYCIPLTDNQQVLNNIYDGRPSKVFLTIKDFDKMTRKEKDVALKLHKQFAHPPIMKNKYKKNKDSCGPPV